MQSYKDLLRMKRPLPVLVRGKRPSSALRSPENRRRLRRVCTGRREAGIGTGSAYEVIATSMFVAALPGMQLENSFKIMVACAGDLGRIFRIVPGYFGFGAGGAEMDQGYLKVES